MSRKSSLFIRSEHRPDLRAALDATLAGHDDLGAANCFTSFPRSYRFSGCKEDSKDDTKKKELTKDDKKQREPTQDRAFCAREGSFHADWSGGEAYTTIFA